jgi:hypothetical protein
MTTCDRCGGDARISIMSKFNRDTLCTACKDDERLAPGYAFADAAEAAAVRGGNYHFAGVGLSAADESFLAARRAARREGVRR